MIEELHLRSLGVIDEATIRLGPGLTVVTGETGAGKTMLLTGLSLVMGGRAEGSMVRGSADRADVDGQWLIAEGTAVAAAVEELGGAVDRSNEGIQVILGRTVSGTGRSKAFAGGRSVPASALAELTAGLVTVHGQSDQLQLKDTRNQRALLDRFAGQELTEVLADFSAALVRLRQAERERDELLAQRQEREREAVLLRHGIDEIAAVQPESGEDASLKQQASALANVTDLLEAMGSAHQSLTGGDGGLDSALDLLVKASRDLDRAAGFDASVRPLQDSLGRVMDELSVLAGEVAHYAATLDADPARLAEVEERRRQVNELMRRYGPRLDDVLEWWKNAEESVSEVDGAHERLAALGEEISLLTDRVRAGALEVTAKRTSAASTFATRITDELQELAMPDAQVTIDIESTDDLAAMTVHGADTVTMLLTPHSGSDPRPLGSGASGGELSRLMLAIEVVLAGVGTTPTFVFDEVDAGIGGRVAVEVGRRLARLAKTAQVIVVTHLPQVAAFGDSHVVVTKDSAGQVTSSSVVTVEGPDRVKELVRMLSGLEDSESGARHATELLQLAESERSAN